MCLYSIKIYYDSFVSCIIIHTQSYPMSSYWSKYFKINYIYPVLYLGYIISWINIIKFRFILIILFSQQAFVGLQDVLKLSSRYVLKTSSTHLQCNIFLSSKMSTSGLEDVLKTSWRRFEDILQDFLKKAWKKKTKNCYVEDVLKTSWRNALKTSWGQAKYLLGYLYLTMAC